MCCYDINIIVCYVLIVYVLFGLKAYHRESPGKSHPNGDYLKQAMRKS